MSYADLKTVFLIRKKKFMVDSDFFAIRTIHVVVILNRFRQEEDNVAKMQSIREHQSDVSSTNGLV